MTHTPVRLTILLLTAVALCSPARAAARKQMTITDHGKPMATIVIAEKANDKARFAAQEFQTYIEKISGVKLSIATDADNPAGPLVLVGRSKLTDEMRVDIPSGMTPAMREEGFVIICKGDRLVLAGNDSKLDANHPDPRHHAEFHGTEYAVYEFLNRLGVRWFMPGEFGEVVPKRATITVLEMHVAEKPAFIMRGWWSYMTPELQEQESRWKLRNKLCTAWPFSLPTDGTARELVPSEKYLKDHPEYFALKADGTRDPNMPNLTNPKSVEIAADTIKAYFGKNPGVNCYGFSLDDGYPRDCSPETLKLSTGITVTGARPNLDNDLSITEEWFSFVNKVTAEVRKEFPDRFIATNGYANRYIPPQGMKLDDHLVIMYACIMSCTIHAYDNEGCYLRQQDGQAFRRWCELSDNVWVYNYEPMLVTALTCLPDAQKVAHDFRLMKKWGSIGFIDEAQNVWAQYSVQGRYVRARLGWDPDQNMDALLRDYYTKWYGSAAKPMRAFWEALEDAIVKAPNHGHEDRVLDGMYSPELLSRLSEHLSQGEKLADTDIVKQRVRADRSIYEHMKGYAAMHDAEAAGDFAAAARWADYMLAQRKKAYEVNPFYFWRNEEGFESGAWYWRVTDRKKYYQSLADKTSGKTGDLIALLPEQARFSPDPHEDGIYANWYEPDFGDSKWKRLLTTRPFYNQGYADKQGHHYDGYMWYRVKVDVPASARGRKVLLCAPNLEAEGWVWINGQYVGRRPYQDAWIRPTPMELDVTNAIEPGKTNTVAIRVGTAFAPGQVPGGLVSRLFLYSPKE